MADMEPSAGWRINNFAACSGGVQIAETCFEVDFRAKKEDFGYGEFKN